MTEWDGKERRKMGSDDHDLLIRIDEKLTKALNEIKDIDTRVGSLEKGYWKVVGMVSAVVIVGDIVIKMVFLK